MCMPSLFVIEFSVGTLIILYIYLPFFDSFIFLQSARPVLAVRLCVLAFGVKDFPPSLHHLWLYHSVSAPGLKLCVGFSAASE